MENCCKNNHIFLKPHGDIGRFSQGPSHSSKGLAASQKEPVHRWLVECHVLRQDLKKLRGADPLSKAADRDTKKPPTKINKIEIKWQQEGCSGHTGRRWAGDGFPGGARKMHPCCQQGPPVFTSWTKLSLCWAFSRNPETLLLCFCPCHGQSGPSPPHHC